MNLLVVKGDERCDLGDLDSDNDKAANEAVSAEGGGLSSRPRA